MKYVNPEGIMAVNSAISELTSFSAALRFLKISSHFKNPKLAFAQKQDWLKSIGHEIGAKEASTKMVLALLSMNQLEILSRVVSAMKELRLQNFGIGESKVITAYPLNPQQKKTVTTLIEKISGLKEAIVIEKINPAVLGGIAITSGDKLLDLTIRRQLKNMLKLVS